jgi:hypothetical protein
VSKFVEALWFHSFQTRLILMALDRASKRQRADDMSEEMRILEYRFYRGL